MRKNNEGEKKFDDTLVEVVQLDSEKAKMYLSSSFLGPNFYNKEDDGDFVYWLRQNPESICDVMMMSHCDILQDDRSSTNRRD